MNAFVMLTAKRIRIMGPDVTKAINMNTNVDVEQAERFIEKQVVEIDWSKVEDAINDQLPEGWYTKIED